MLDDSPRVISAHGRWEDGYFTMPEGTSLTLHSPHGALIDHKLGNAIEQGLMESGWSQTYRSGDKVRNYVLTRLPADKVVGNPIQPPPGTRTTLKDVLKPGMGECHGSFCRWEIGHTLDSETWTQQTWQSLDHLLKPPPAGSLR
jgi:hypothetical protein